MTNITFYNLLKLRTKKTSIVALPHRAFSINSTIPPAPLELTSNIGPMQQQQQNPTPSNTNISPSNFAFNNNHNRSLLAKGTFSNAISTQNHCEFLNSNVAWPQEEITQNQSIILPQVIPMNEKFSNVSVVQNKFQNGNFEIMHRFQRLMF